MTTLTVAERIAQIKQARLSGEAAPQPKATDGLWWEHKRDELLRRASAKADELQARRLVAAQLREELAAQRKADGLRW